MCGCKNLHVYVADLYNESHHQNTYNIKDMYSFYIYVVYLQIILYNSFLSTSIYKVQTTNASLIYSKPIPIKKWVLLSSLNHFLAIKLLSWMKMQHKLLTTHRFDQYRKCSYGLAPPISCFSS